MRKKMTPEELSLWLDFLKKIPYTVNRQKIIGRYIVDFYCSKGKIAIEIDGSQHNSKEGLAADAERDAYLNSLGIKVLRYSNEAIRNNFNNVCEDIKRNLLEKK